MRRLLPNGLAVSLCPIVFFLAAAVRIAAQAPGPTEYQVKAAYLSNFGRFVEWPARTSSAEDQPFTVCVLGEDPFGPALDSALAGEVIRKAPVVPRRISGVHDAAFCRIIFISRSEEPRLKTILPALQSTGALTVSDVPQFARRGGMIGLVLAGSKVRFEINVAALEQAGLTVSSELLKLAVAVRKGPR